MPTYSDPAKNKEYLRLWHLKNRERRLRDRKERYRRKRDLELAQNAGYRKANPEVYRRSHKKWSDKNKPYNAARQHKYRAIRYGLLKAATVNLAAIVGWVKSSRAEKRFTCYYCQDEFPTSDLHFDHIIPLAKGGPHSVENLCKSCSHCNKTKSSKPVRLWIKTGQQLLEL